MRAACSSQLKNYKAAISDYNKALKLANNSDEKGWIHFDMAVLYAQMGDENISEDHLVTAAKFGHGLAQNFCSQYGIRY